MFVEAAATPPAAARRSSDRHLLAVALEHRAASVLIEALAREMACCRDHASVTMVSAVAPPAWWWCAWPMAVIPPALPHGELVRETVEDLSVRLRLAIDAPSPLILAAERPGPLVGDLLKGQRFDVALVSGAVRRGRRLGEAGMLRALLSVCDDVRLIAS